MAEADAQALRDALAEKYYKAGARYLMTQGTHHDHFFNYESKINRMNSVNVGPGKDILALWKAAARRSLRSDGALAVVGGFVLL